MTDRTPNVSLNALRAFKSVALHLSMSRAAVELGVTHGAVSRQISAMEAQLGVELFSRHKGRLQLSTAGAVLFADVAAAFDRLDAALRNVVAQASPSTLLVNVAPTFAMRWLIPRLASFQRRHPGVEIRLTTGKAPLGDPSLSGFDVVVRRQAKPSKKGGSVPFLASFLIPVCAPELLEKRPVHDAADMARHVLLHSNQQAAEWPEWFEKAGLPGQRPASELVFEEIYFAVQAALEGMGVALAPAPLVADDLAAGRLAMPMYVERVGLRDHFHYKVSPTSTSQALAQDFGQWLQREGDDANRMAAEVIGEALGQLGRHGMPRDVEPARTRVAHSG